MFTTHWICYKNKWWVVFSSYCICAVCHESLNQGFHSACEALLQERRLCITLFKKIPFIKEKKKSCSQMFHIQEVASSWHTSKRHYFSRIFYFHGSGQWMAMECFIYKFHLKGFFSPQNCRIWTKENPFAYASVLLHSESNCVVRVDGIVYCRAIVYRGDLGPVGPLSSIVNARRLEHYQVFLIFQ